MVACDINKLYDMNLTQGRVVNHFLTLQSVDDILAKIKNFSPLMEEELPLHSCLGRTLAADFLSPEDLPGFTRSTMDGFAVRARDVFGASEGSPALLDYLGECHMGEVPTLKISQGQTARIWTGGMLPEGADAVVMLEYARELSAGQIELTRPVAPFDNVITKDEDAAKGQLLLQAGTVLRPQELGLFAGLGQMTVRVRKKPRVAVISSGDEVVPCAATPAIGQVRDINSTTLMAFAAQLGAEAKFYGLAGDDRKILSDLVAKALEYSDIILLSGGSSAGQRDFTVGVLESMPEAEILAHGVAISPGKPLIFARVGEKSLWGLPGHVASALVCAEVFIKPMILTLAGAKNTHPKTIFARMSRPIASAQGRRDYIRVSLENSVNAFQEPSWQGDSTKKLNNELLPLAKPVMGKSGLISTLVAAEGLAICPENTEGFGVGEIVEVQLLS